MKKIFLTLMVALISMMAMAQKQAEIVFENDTIDLGQFSEKKATQSCVFRFTNTGDAPLIIHQAIASCGCTVPEYEKEPIRPGQKGEIKVTYNGKGKLLGPFTKTISVRSNAKTNVARLFLKGDMTKD